MSQARKKIFFFKNLFPISFFFLSGCMVGPNYKTPKTTLPEKYSEYPESYTEQMAEQNQKIQEWWQQFQDPFLNTLVIEILQNNYDIQIAEEKIQTARAFYRFKTAELFPEVDLAGSIERSEFSKNFNPNPFIPLIQNDFKIGFDASWELDFFGKLRRSKEAAFYDVQAQIESKKNVQILVTSELIATYAETCALKDRIELIKRQIELQKELLSLEKTRYGTGLTSEIAFFNIQSRLDSLISSLPPLEAGYKASLYQITYLLGRKTGPVDFSKATSLLGASQKITLPVGLPSDLLRRRPDVREAERQLGAATARIGEAIADLFPRFSLLGSFGWESNHSKNWISAGSKTWNIGPGIFLPILNFGRIRAQIDEKKAEERQAFFQYEKTILAALKEVESSLVEYFKGEEREKSLEKQLITEKASLDLMKNRYQSGLINFSEVLDEEQRVYATENTLIQSKRTVLIALVALYKALGGDWDQSYPCAEKSSKK